MPLKVKKTYLKQSGQPGGTTAKMDDANRCLCFALRNPPRGEKPMKLRNIRKIVRKTDGSRPENLDVHLLYTNPNSDL